ncbi:TRAP transporter small permease subunit [Roseibium alexandrii]|uniref:TRAP transporter small permease protein n=2 Tax=Roseibium alexandrii TaxID=388408 RepID=A0A0M6ZV94_9HYPH|nr:TRAP transporter small permease subunit [Roseibium alexandrii]EEE44885.1 TRAP-type mannitol/chloroaromatic compound transport system, small permease component [Roseibium alexandrii DFL-11]CTQ66151.1 TRAP-type mannitol/chloroaromatic compound transport system, small permease component [Roseibium alexandrii]
MPRIAHWYVHAVDGFNRGLGKVIMWGVFVMAGILLWSSISKTFFNPSLWTLEVAQFAMVAYYVLGGPYSVQLGSNVRMDLFYAEWSIKKKAWFDAFTVLLLMFYLGVLLYGALGSMAYSLGYFGREFPEFYWELIMAFFTGGPVAAGEVMGYIERSPTAWRPVLWPIKVTMCIGFFLMLLQTISELIKDIATIRGETI